MNVSSRMKQAQAQPSKEANGFALKDRMRQERKIRKDTRDVGERQSRRIQGQGGIRGFFYRCAPSGALFCVVLSGKEAT